MICFCGLGFKPEELGIWSSIWEILEAILVFRKIFGGNAALG